MPSDELVFNQQCPTSHIYRVFIDLCGNALFCFDVLPSFTSQSLRPTASRPFKHAVVIMHFTALLSVAAIAVSSSLVSAQSNTCRSSDLQFVRTNIAQPKPFCKWYLSRGRTRSPLAKFKAKQMTKLCKCLLPPRERVKARKTNSKPKTGRIYCDKSDLKQLTRQFRGSPKNFCKFYTARYVFVNPTVQRALL